MQRTTTPSIVIKEHIKTKLQTLTEDKDTASGHIRHEQGIRNDYMGRAPFELLQNAIDRADSKVVLKLCRETATFSVSNDGQPFSYTPSEKECRSDFAALCAVNASNKIAGQSIGNKGVGFRSIWQYCKKVRILSRLSSSPVVSWGFRLHFPFDESCVETWDNTDTANNILRGMNELPGDEKGKAPSFYFPEYLPKETIEDDSIVTSIILEGLSEKKLNDLENLLLKIAISPLMFASFVSIEQRNGTPMFAEFDICNETSSVSLLPDDNKYHVLKINTADVISLDDELLSELDYHLTKSPQLYLAVPLSDTSMAEGYYHCYLPTEIKTGCPLHIHGDFFAESNRKQINFESNDYNKKLLKLAAKSLLIEIKNNHNLFSIKTICEVLMAEGALLIEFKVFLSSGKNLAMLIANILSHEKLPTFSEIDKLYQLIAHYAPVRGHYGRIETHKVNTSNYYSFFSRPEIKIVPLITRGPESNGADESPNCVTIPKKEEKKLTRLFCLSKNSNVKPIKAAGVVVTPWRFPHYVEAALLMIDVWTEYSDSEAVITALGQSQRNNDSDEQREALLHGAINLAPHNNDIKTNWRFSGKQLHPTQRLLVPAISKSGWEKVSSCYFEDEYINSGNLDNKTFFKIDLVRAQKILGSEFKSQLLYWGVWNVLPLVTSNVENPNWSLSKPISEFELDSAEVFSLLARSFSVWKKTKQFVGSFERINLNYHKNLRDELIREAWIPSNSGEFISPKNCFLSLKHHRYNILPCVINDNLSPNKSQLLSWLDVKSLDDEYHTEKLLNALNRLATKVTDKNHRSIGAEYRLLIKQLNEPKNRDTLNPSTIIPRMVKDKNRIRFASDDEQVFFFSNEERRLMKNSHKFGYSLWDVNRETSVVLSEKISGVIRPKLTSFTEPVIEKSWPDENSFKLIQKEILPSLFAYAEIAEEIQREPDEEAIRNRWSTVKIRRHTNMVAGFRDSENVPVDVKELEQERVLIIGNKKRNEPAILVLHENLKLEDIDDKARLAGWLAQEIFGMNELLQGFSKVLKADIELDSSRISEYGKAISSWLSDDEENQIIAWLQTISHSILTNGRWRWFDSYKNQGVSFTHIKDVIPPNWHWVVESLNPIEVNKQTLEVWLELNSKKLKFLLPDKELNMKSLVGRDSLNLFDFNPEGEVLRHLNIALCDFNHIDKTKDIELAELSRDFETTIPLADSGKSLGTKTITANGTVRTGRLSKTKDQSQRNEEAEAKAESGKRAEAQIAIRYAQFCSKLNKEEQLKIHANLKIELLRLKKEHLLMNEVLLWLNNQIEKGLPATEKEWYELLHIGCQFDGCGYDVIGFDEETKDTLLVEVKRSRLDESPEIFFSENERRCFINLSSVDFKKDNPNTHWRIFLSYGFADKAKNADVTEVIVSALNQHALAYDKLDRPLNAEGWHINLTSV